MLPCFSHDLMLTERYAVLIESSVHFRPEGVVTGEGELLWDVEAGHLRAFELEAEVEASFSASWTSRSGVNDYELTLQQELEGELLVRAGLGEGDEE